MLTTELVVNLFKDKAIFHNIELACFAVEQNSVLVERGRVVFKKLFNIFLGGEIDGKYRGIFTFHLQIITQPGKNQEKRSFTREDLTNNNGL
jgi:hypothetical protein